MGNTNPNNYCALDCGDENTPTPECIRTVLLTIMFVLTLLACITQMTRIFINTKQLISYQMGVLLLASIESFLGFLHWGFFDATSWNYWIIFLKETELVVITYFFILSALIAFAKRHLEKRVLWPSFAIILLFLLAVTVWATYSDKKGKHNNGNCSSYAFISLSATGLLLSTIFLITGILITRQLKKQSISENIRRKKKLELWALIFVYFVVSLTSAGEDIFDLILHSQTNSCSLFDSESYAKAITVLAEHTFNLLVPIWAILVVYNIEASRAKGRSLRRIREEQSTNSSDPESSPMDFDFLVGGNFHSVQSYFSVSNDQPTTVTSDDDDVLYQ